MRKNPSCFTRSDTGQKIAGNSQTEGGVIMETAFTTKIAMILLFFIRVNELLILAPARCLTHHQGVLPRQRKMKQQASTANLVLPLTTSIDKISKFVVDSVASPRSANHIPIEQSLLSGVKKRGCL
jgi:hypothetical protein